MCSNKLKNEFPQRIRVTSAEVMNMPSFFDPSTNLAKFKQNADYRYNSRCFTSKVSALPLPTNQRSSLCSVREGTRPSSLRLPCGGLQAFICHTLGVRGGGGRDRKRMFDLHYKQTVVPWKRYELKKQQKRRQAAVLASASGGVGGGLMLG